MLGSSSRERLEGVPEKLGLANRLVLEGPRTSRLLREPLLTSRCRFVQLAVLDLQMHNQAAQPNRAPTFAKQIVYNHKFGEEVRQHRNQTVRSHSLVHMWCCATGASTAGMQC